MKSFAFADRKIPKKDLITGIGTSFLVHFLVFSCAIIWAWVMPHKPLKPPYCTVNLVSLKDVGMGAPEPKGNPKATEDSAVHENLRSSGKTTGKSDAVAPIKRLTVDDAVKKPEAQIKKIEPKEVPVEPQKSQGLEAIEKNLDKLVAKPKVIPHTSSEAAEKTAPQPKNSTQPATAPGPAKEQPGTEKPGKGTPTGAVEAGNLGTTHGSTSGTPDGSTAMNRLASLYGEQIRQRIEREWRLANDQGIGGLKAVVEVQIKKSGEIVSVKVMAKSGNEGFDDAAVRAVNRAAPLPPVPEAIVQGSTKLILTFLPGHVSQ
jgi:TonB family protein